MTQPTFLTRLRQGIRDCGGLHGTIVVGVSGGADSVALLIGLSELASEAAGFDVCAVHVDHGIRENSAADADWVAALAADLQVPFRVVRPEIIDRAATTTTVSEEAARRGRYRSLQQQAEELGSRFVAVAHHRDDDVETILHHIIRGTGLRGLRGVPATRALGEHVVLVRPMLRMTREHALSFLAERAVSFLQDGTNADVRFTRNRIRHELLPLLEAEFNPNVRQSLARLARQAADADEVISNAVAGIFSTACDLAADRAVVHCNVLQATPVAIVRALLQRVWVEQRWPRQQMGFEEWDRVASLVRQPGRSLSLPGRISARRRGDRLVLKQRRPESGLPDPDAGSVSDA